MTVRPPTVIPGVAEIEIRMYVAGHPRNPRRAYAAHRALPRTIAPTPDLMQRSKLDPQFFTGAVWMMAPGSWQVRIQVDGGQGAGTAVGPGAGCRDATKSMQFALGAFLFVMMIVLVVGVVSIVGAGAREGQLTPGAGADDPVTKRRARILMGATAVIVVLVLWGGNHWWSAEANDYAGNLYKPMEMTATVDARATGWC